MPDHKHVGPPEVCVLWAGEEGTTLNVVFTNSSPQILLVIPWGWIPIGSHTACKAFYWIFIHSSTQLENWKYIESGGQIITVVVWGFFNLFRLIWYEKNLNNFLYIRDEYWDYTFVTMILGKAHLSLSLSYSDMRPMCWIVVTLT